MGLIDFRGSVTFFHATQTTHSNQKQKGVVVSQMMEIKRNHKVSIRNKSLQIALQVRMFLHNIAWSKKDLAKAIEPSTPKILVARKT